MAKTSPSKQLAAQVAFAKAADAKIAAPELIEECEQELAEEAIAAAKQPCRDA